VLNTQNIQALKRKVMLQNLGFGGSRMMFDLNPPKPVPRADASASARSADSAGHRTR
jgi:hypothetical protein